MAVPNSEWESLCMSLHDLADDITVGTRRKGITKIEIINRIRSLAGEDIREGRCEYVHESGRHCPNWIYHHSRLCSYHGHISSVRFDPKYADNKKKESETNDG